ELDVGPGRVEVRVAGDRLAGAADDREEDLLRRTALVGGDHVLEREEILDALVEAEPRGRAGVGLVTALDAGPLLGGHRAGPRVGQQVDDHVRRVEAEEVVARLAEVALALLHRGHPDRLDALDPERLDDRLPLIHDGSIGAAPEQAEQWRAIMAHPIREPGEESQWRTGSRWEPRSARARQSPPGQRTRCRSSSSGPTARCGTPTGTALRGTSATRMGGTSWAAPRPAAGERIGSTCLPAGATGRSSTAGTSRRAGSRGSRSASRSRAIRRPAAGERIGSTSSRGPIQASCCTAGGTAGGGPSPPARAEARCA